MKSLFTTLLALIWALSAKAQIHTETNDYRHGDTVLEGYLACDVSIKGKRPGVLIVHQWKGLTDYEKKRAEMLAKLGYNVFALDIYGQGIRPKSSQAPECPCFWTPGILLARTGEEWGKFSRRVHGR